METAEIITKIQAALKSCAESNSIPAKDVRVKISREKGFLTYTTKCVVMNKSSVVQEVNLKELLGLNPVQAPLVNNYLGNSLCSMAKKEKISEETVNGRFYTTSDDYTPRLYLYDGGSPMREIKVEELIN